MTGSPYQIPQEIEQAFISLRRSARTLRSTETLDSTTKNRVLRQIADGVLAGTKEIVEANQEDLRRLPESTSPAFRDRLTLNPDRIKSMVTSLIAVASLPDPVGEELDSHRLANGLLMRRVRAPLGVIFMIFESRPNVILEAFSLAFKSGNAIALRGGSDSRSTATVIYRLMRESLKASGLSPDLFYGLDNYDRPLVEALLKRKDLIDVTVPRGGDRLIEMVTTLATMPIIKNDRGMCHGYVDAEADLEMATRVIKNAKTQRPGVCNSLETLLVHRSIAAQFLPKLFAATSEVPLRWKCDPESFHILQSATARAGETGNSEFIEPATSQDWDTEHLDQIMNCHIVGGVDEAISHIETHGSRHSETILTRNEITARRFQNEVDAAAVYWNASTRFTDGFEFGLGGELGISTQKLHVRGPVGLRELTTPRWLIDGDGQIRG